MECRNPYKDYTWRDDYMFNRVQIKSFIAGVTVSSIVTASVSIFADPLEKQISAVFNNIELIVDGQEIVPKDLAGNVVEPFIYNGTTYLPVRALAQALGKPVDWNGNKNRVYIGSRSLTSLRYVEDDEFIKTGMWDSMYNNDGEDVRNVCKLSGKEYNQSIVYHLYSHLTEGHLIYNLNSQYKKLSGIFGIDDDSAARIKRGSTEDDTNKYYTKDYIQLKVTGDGKVIYLSPEIKADDKPVEVSADLTDVKQIRIDYVYSATESDAIDLDLVLADPKIE